MDKLLLEGQEGSGRSYLCTYSNFVPTILYYLQLYVRRGTMPASVDDIDDPWTTFQMTLREPGSIPPAFDLTRFLASSITFMMHLSEVSVYLDGMRLVRLSKNCGSLKEMPMPNGFKCTSPKKMMNVKAIETMCELSCNFWETLSIPIHCQRSTSRRKWFDGCTMSTQKSLPLYLGQMLPRQ
jgi:Protein of unknown function (DUF3684)